MRRRTDNINKNTALAMDRKALQGIGKHFANVRTVTIAGVIYSPAALKALFQEEIDATNALDASRAQLRERVKAIRAIRANAAAMRSKLGAHILGKYGAGAIEVLADFGMTPPGTPGPKTAEAKARGTARRIATLEARRAALAALTAPASPSRT